MFKKVQLSKHNAKYHIPTLIIGHIVYVKIDVTKTTACYHVLDTEFNSS